MISNYKKHRTRILFCLNELKKDEIKISEQYNDFEINNLSYEKAIINDNRTYWQYYLSLIKTKQLVIFSFYLSTDYNLRTIKINLFFLTFGMFVFEVQHVNLSQIISKGKWIKSIPPLFFPGVR